MRQPQPKNDENNKKENSLLFSYFYQFRFVRFSTLGPVCECSNIQGGFKIISHMILWQKKRKMKRHCDIGYSYVLPRSSLFAAISWRRYHGRCHVTRLNFSFFFPFLMRRKKIIIFTVNCSVWVWLCSASQGQNATQWSHCIQWYNSNDYKLNALLVCKYINCDALTVIAFDETKW